MATNTTVQHDVEAQRRVDVVILLGIAAAIAAAIPSKITTSTRRCASTSCWTVVLVAILQSRPAQSHVEPLRYTGASGSLVVKIGFFPVAGERARKPFPLRWGPQCPSLHPQTPGPPPAARRAAQPPPESNPAPACRSCSLPRTPGCRTCPAGEARPASPPPTSAGFPRRPQGE